MSYLKHNSWGRTRCPKNLSGSQGGEVAVVLVSDLTDATEGYATQNQRYLHVLVTDKNVGGGLTVTVYGYSHAFQKWFPLTIPAKTDAIEVTAPNTSTAEGSQNASHREHIVWEILGVDRVAFVGTAADVRCYAACSTF
jgi:hypothetical protein